MKDLKDYHYILDGSPSDLIAIGIFADVSGYNYDLNDILEDIFLGTKLLLLSPDYGNIIEAWESSFTTTPITLPELIELYKEIQK